MIVIKNIEILEVPGERCDFHSFLSSENYPIMEVGTANGTTIESVDVVRELIIGREFRRPDGQTIVVGVSKQAEDIIGLQYEAWENQSKLVEELSRDCGRLQVKVDQLHRHDKEKQWALNEITGASLWTRLKWLFTGIKIPEA